MKKAPNDTDLLLYPTENEDPKELPDLLAYKPCTAYMGHLKIMFMDKFRENTPPLVFHRENWSRILSAILSMKLFTAGSIISGLSIPNNEQVSEYIYIYILMCNEMYYCYGGFVHLIDIVIQQ